MRNYKTDWLNFALDPSSLTNKRPIRDSQPYRFFGPVADWQADAIADQMLDSPKFLKTLLEFLQGQIEPRELCYELQVHAENAEANLKAALNDEGLCRDEEHA